MAFLRVSAQGDDKRELSARQRNPLSCTCQTAYLQKNQAQTETYAEVMPMALLLRQCRKRHQQEAIADDAGDVEPSRDSRFAVEFCQAPISTPRRETRNPQALYMSQTIGVHPCLERTLHTAASKRASDRAAEPSFDDCMKD